MLLSFMLLAGLTSGLQARTGEGGEITLHRLRSVDASMRAAIEEGCRRSPLFSEIVRAVEQSNFVVYVVKVPSLRNGMKGALLHGTGGPQHLRIHVRGELTLDRQVAVLAHELQHVREVIQAGISTHPAEMEMLFRRIGGRRLSAGRRQQFETAAAVRVGDAVAADLGTNRRDAPSLGGCRADDVGPNPVVVVHIENPHGLEMAGLDRARELATEIYRRAGVSLRWTSAEAAEPDRTLTLVLARSRPLADLGSDALGVAPGPGDGTRGTLAYVFLDKVTSFADSHRLAVAHVFACALAHEIGHLLLPPNAHRLDSVMRDDWHPGLFPPRTPGILGFPPDQAKLLRLRARRQ